MMKKKLYAFIGLAYIILILSGCGQTGSLYLPKQLSTDQHTSIGLKSQSNKHHAQ